MYGSAVAIAVLLARSSLLYVIIVILFSFDKTRNGHRTTLHFIEPYKFHIIVEFLG